MAKLKRGFVLEEHFIDPSRITTDKDVTAFMPGMEVQVIAEIEPDTDGTRLFIIFSPELKEATVVAEYVLDFGYDN